MRLPAANVPTIVIPVRPVPRALFAPEPVDSSVFIVLREMIVRVIETAWAPNKLHPIHPLAEQEIAEDYQR